MSLLNVSALQNIGSGSPNVILNVDGSVTLPVYSNATTAPTPAQAGTLWFNGTSLQIRNLANSAWVSGGGSGVAAITGTLPIAITGTATNPIIAVNAATTALPGSVQLADGAASAAGSSATLVSTPAFTVAKDTSGMGGAALLPSGGNYAGATAGMFRFNTTSSHVEFYDGGAWQTSVNRSGDTMTGNLNIDTPATGTGLLGTVGTGTGLYLDNGGTVSSFFNTTSIASSLLFFDTAIAASATAAINSGGFATFLNRDSPLTSNTTIGGVNGPGQWLGLTLKGYPYFPGAGVQPSTSFSVQNAAGTQNATIGPNTYLMYSSTGGAMMYLDPGNNNLAFTTDAGGAKFWFFQTNGDGVCNNGTWISLSDAREKTDIEPLVTESTPANEYTEKIKNLRPVTFHRIGREDDPLEMGFIAQDVQEEFPLLTPTTERDTRLPQEEDQESETVERLALNYNGLTAPMVAAMQEMIARIESLEAELAALKGA